MSSFLLSLISLIISIGSAILSLISLWKTHFSKFKPITMVGDLKLRIYPIRSGVKKWYIPSLDVPITVSNEAARPGKVLCIKIIVSFPKLPIKGNREVFYPRWEVNTEKFEKYGRKRFDWIEDAVINNWMPFVVLPKASITKHIVFESFSWENPVIQEEVSFIMQLYSEPDKKWLKIGEWKLSLTPVIWSELTENGTSFSTKSVDSFEIEHEGIFPSDLHKYTGIKEKIPKGGFRAKASYLDFKNSSEKLKKN